MVSIHEKILGGVLIIACVLGIIGFMVGAVLGTIQYFDKRDCVEVESVLEKGEYTSVVRTTPVECPK